MEASPPSSVSPLNRSFDFFCTLPRRSRSTLATRRLPTKHLTRCIDFLLHRLLLRTEYVQSAIAHAMRRWTAKPYKDTYTQTQIDEVRALGTSERDMLEILICTQDYKLTVEDARKAIIAREEGKNCPYCGKELEPGQARRYRNRHVNGCAKKREKGSLIRTLEQTQPASPPKSPLPTSSPASSKPTPSSASSFSSPSRSPKRKAADENGPASGDGEVEGTMNDSNEQEQSEASPLAKRPKLAEDNASELIMGKALFKKQPGTIDIDRARNLITWQPEDCTIAKAVVIMMADLTNYQRNTAGGASNPGGGLNHKIISQGLGEPKPSSHIFKFPSTDDGRRVSDAISDVLAPLARAARSRDDGGEEVVFEAAAPSGT